MAGHASNWFKTGGAGASAKGRMFISNTALGRLGMTKGAARAGLNEGSVGIRNALRGLATTPSGVAQSGGAISRSQQPKVETPRRPPTLQELVQDIIAQVPGSTYERRESSFSSGSYAVVNSPNYSGQINFTQAGNPRNPDAVEQDAREQAGAMRRAPRLAELASEAGIVREIEVMRSRPGTFIITVKGSGERGRGAQRDQAFLLSAAALDNDDGARAYLAQLAKENPGFKRRARGATGAVARNTLGTAQQPVTGDPRTNTPVSSALDFPGKSSRTNAPIVEALKAIDLVHKDGELPKIPINSRRSTKRLGAYFSTTTGKALKIDLNPSGDHPIITTLHEIGHFLDNQALNPVPGGYGSEGGRGALFDSLRGAINQSAAVQQLTSIAGKSSLPYTRPDGSQGTMLVSPQYVNYLLKGREKFARAYAQYVATRSGSAQAMAELNEQRSEKYSSNTLMPGQWSDEDFEPIAQAFDALFADKGWR